MFQSMALAAGAVSISIATLCCTAGSTTEFGVYKGPGCVGREKIPEFERFVGRKVERTVDALNQDTWPAMRSSIDWVVGCWSGSNLNLTLSVPMLPRDGTGQLSNGADGAYDDIFKRTGEALVQHGYANATVRVGWEFNGKFQPWNAVSDPAAYVRYFRHIVLVMRGIKGQTFSFEWCPTHGRHDIDPPAAYPGDGYVDIVGMDVYNEYWNPLEEEPHLRWESYLDRPFGLKWQREFALQHNKKTAFPEWGTGTNPFGTGGGDDPVFVAGMARWIASVNPLYQSYWDNPSAEFNTMISNYHFPRAATAYIASFKH